MATGANRTRIKWGSISDLYIPYPAKTKEEKFSKLFAKAQQEEAKAQKMITNQIEMVMEELKLKSKMSEEILLAFKPPK